MTTSAITTPQRCFVPPPVLDTGDGEARSNLTAHAATEPGPPLSNAAGAHHSRSLTLTSAVDPCSRPSRRRAALPSAMPKSPYSAPPQNSSPRVPSLEAFGRRPRALSRPAPRPASETLHRSGPLARSCLRLTADIRNSAASLNVGDLHAQTFGVQA